MEGRALQGNTTTLGTLEDYHHAPSPSSSLQYGLHNIPCQTHLSTFALGNSCNAHLQRHPHTSTMYLATTKVTSSRARCAQGSEKLLRYATWQGGQSGSHKQDPAYRRATPAPPYLDGEH